MSVMNVKRLIFVATVLAMGLFLTVPLCATSLIFNGGLERGAPSAPRPGASTIQSLRNKGWTCPDPIDWPAWWGARGSGVTLETFPTGGKKGAYCRMSGRGGSIVCPAYPLKEWLKWVKEEEKEKYGQQHLFSIWVRGRGVLKVGFEAFGETKDGKPASVIAPEPFTFKVDSGVWVRYSHVVRSNPDVKRLNPVVGPLEGEVDFDELTLWPAEPARALLVEEQERLYGTGALVEDMEMVAADRTFFEKASEFKSAAQAFRSKKNSIDEKLFKSLQDIIDGVSPYALTKGITVVQTIHYNDMIALTRALKRLAGEEPGAPVVIRPRKVPEIKITHRPGEREARPGKITITDVRSDKVRYNENETATTTVTVLSKWSNGTHPPEGEGQLIARMVLDLDTVREVARTDFHITIPSRHARVEEKKWQFTYNVGPETYGRALEVEFVDNEGNTIDKWQEYYAVAAEYFRVQLHSYQSLPKKHYKVDFWTTYFNQAHYFGSAPTDFGVKVTDVEAYISAQPNYRMNWPSRKPAMEKMKNAGIAVTFYQTGAFGGQMGFEEARKHPEYVLYDETGQFGIDPVYGGFPNPMELASPIEVGPKRKNLKVKPYLDLDYKNWQHIPVNLAMEEAILYEVDCIKQYAKAHGFDGVYWDGTLGIWDGYNYDGTRNVPSRKYEDYVRLNARNHRIYTELLKKDNPNFGTWFNWGMPGAYEWGTKAMGLKLWLGTGIGDDPLNDSIRAATNAKNVMLLNEQARLTTGKISYPEKTLAMLLQNRDKHVQEMGANTLMGYMSFPMDYDEPGLTRWGWVTMNHFMAQIIAAQSRLAGGFAPSMRPSFQFQTRYSRFIWARDIKAVPVEEVEKIIELKTPEEIWWKRLVYKRKTDEGYDLIVHLVRIPPFKQWDINWVDEPVELGGIRIAADIGGGKLADVQACRPYYFEEEEQVVQKVLDAKVAGGKAAVEVPPFRYYTMVVFRVKDRKAGK